MKAELCKPLVKLTSVTAEWSWNNMYHGLYDKATNIIKQDAFMKFYDALKPLYLETDASSISLRAGLLQVRAGMNCGCDEVPDNTAVCPIALASNSLASTEQ